MHVIFICFALTLFGFILFKNRAKFSNTTSRAGAVSVALSLIISAFITLYWSVEENIGYRDFDDFLEFYFELFLGKSASILFLCGLLLISGLAENIYIFLLAVYKWVKQGEWDIKYRNLYIESRVLRVVFIITFSAVVLSMVEYWDWNTPRYSKSGF
jgi:hypothetical protein